jgi:hypothetical protein
MQCPTSLNTMTLENWFLMFSALGEFLIAFVIYWEWEGNRFDNFLKDAADNNKERKKVFDAYCGLSCPDNKARNEVFKEMLGSEEHTELKDICDENIRLFSRVGARLPLLPPLRGRVLDWHVVVFLWEILGPYVEERRRAAGPSFAVTFLKYALASVKHLQKQKRDSWVVIDPNVTRKHDVVITRTRMAQMQEDLQRGLEGL